MAPKKEKPVIKLESQPSMQIESDSLPELVPDMQQDGEIEDADVDEVEVADEVADEDEGGLEYDDGEEMGYETGFESVLFTEGGESVTDVLASVRDGIEKQNKILFRISQTIALLASR